MRKFINVFIFLFIIYIWSCAPLKKEEICRLEFQKLVKNSHIQKPVFVRGNIFVHGVYMVFYGNLGEKNHLTFRSPIGKKLFVLDYDRENICVELPKGKKICGRELDIYWDYLNIKIPFDIKELVTGRFKIKPEDNFSCKDYYLYIKRKDMEIKYRNLKPVEAKVKEFKVNYFYENGKLRKIVITEKNREVFRIYIREIRQI